MAKTVYTCATCNTTISGKWEFDQHCRTTEHREKDRAQRDAQRAEDEQNKKWEHALAMFDHAHLPIVDSYEDVEKVSALTGLDKSVVWCVYRMNDALGDDVSKFVRYAKDLSDRVQRDIVQRVETYGAARTYGDTIRMSTVRDIDNAEAAIKVRSEDLGNLARALRVRVRNVHAPAVWQLHNTLATFQIAAMGSHWLLGVPSVSPEFTTFATRGDAAVEALRRANELMGLEAGATAAGAL